MSALCKPNNETNKSKGNGRSPTADNVKITPEKLVFNNVYPGGEPSGKFSIWNKSKTCVSVKIVPPEIKGFSVDASKERFSLKPGQKIFQTVQIQIQSVNCLEYKIPIFINNRKVIYNVSINLCSPKISVEPQSLDYGVLDEGVVSQPLLVSIVNDGFSMTTFHVDAAQMHGHVIVEPNKGVVLDRQSVALRVRVAPVAVGALRNLLVIKCDKKRYAVAIQAAVITPRLEVVRPRTLKMFAPVYFGRTYFGLRIERRILIRNYSAADCVFATAGEHDNKAVSLEKLSKLNPDIEAFQLTPIDGIMLPQETLIICATYSPLYNPRQTRKYFFCATLLVQKLRCKHMKDGFIESETYNKTPDTSFSNRGSTYSLNTLASLSTRSVEEMSMITEMEAKAFTGAHGLFENNTARFFLCGEAELPSVKIVPDELIFDNLKIQCSDVRVLELKNLSENLPITLSYRKIPFVHLRQKTVTLAPLQSEQIAVTVVPQQLGTTRLKLIFDLSHYDKPKDGPPKVIGSVTVKVRLSVKSVTSNRKAQINRKLDPQYMKEEGKFCDGLQFNATIFENTKAITVGLKNPLDSERSDLVALPNETRMSLRPWRSDKPCRSMFMHQPRYVPPVDKTYERTDSEQELRTKVRSYYNKHIRNCATQQKQKNKPGATNYQVVPRTKLLAQDMVCLSKEGESKKPPVCSYFIPLTPAQMRNITTDKISIRKGPVAANHSIVFPVKIHNENNFAVQLYIRSDKSNVGCVVNNRFVIDSNKSLVVKLVYLTGAVGCYANVVDLIFNECMMLPLPIVVDVAAKVLRPSALSLSFTDTKAKRYLTLMNDLNVSVKFRFIVDCPNFVIFPTNGTVYDRKSIKCLVEFLPEVDGPTTCTVKMVSGDTTNQNIVFNATHFRKQLELVTKSVDFENVPLYDLKVTFPVLNNPHDMPISFKVNKQKLNCSWIQVFPMEGTVRANSQLALAVSALCRSCVVFEGVLLIENGIGAKDLELQVKGTVIYPDIKITPSSISFQKIIANTHTSQKFMIKNDCPLHTHVVIQMSEYDEFRITDEQHFWNKLAYQPIIFKPYEEKRFFIHFCPSELMSTWFYLPIVIDKILGPPLKNDVITQTVHYYIGDNQEEDDNFKCTPLKIPNKIPCVKISALALPPKIILSKRKIFFKVNYRTEKQITYVLKVKNAQSIHEVVYIRTSRLDSPFTFHSKDEPIETDPNLVVRVELDPQEEEQFEITYQPESCGQITVFLPIFLQSEGPQQVHTMIELIGVHERPFIGLCPRRIELVEEMSNQTVFKEMVHTNDDFVLCCRPLPEYIRVFSLRKVQFRNHRGDCVVTYASSDPRVTIEDGGPAEAPQSAQSCSGDVCQYRYFKITNVPSQSGMYTVTCNVRCSCGGQWRRWMTGAIENCFLTNYAFTQMFLRSLMTKSESVPFRSTSLIVKPTLIGDEYAIYEFWHLFPLFPNKPDDNFTDFMNGCVNAMEMWASTQGFFQKVHLLIPNTFNQFWKKKIETKGKSEPLPNGSQVHLNYIELLRNLIGPKLDEYIQFGPFPPTVTEQTYYVLKMFEKALTLVKDHGGTFSYSSPEFYLPYQYFVVYKQDLIAKKQCNDVPYPLCLWPDNMDEFYLLSKQKWLQLILQTYKVFYISRLSFRQEPNKTYVPPMQQFMTELPELCLKCGNIYSPAEQCLLAWVEYHYANSNPWFPNKLPEKVISIIGDCFIDGIVFAVLTSVYCPYMTSYFNDMYLKPETREECIHNILTLLNCWELMNYSLMISAHELLRPHSMRIHTLISYLYSFLPSNYPTEVMDFKAGLSVKCSRSIKLNNPNDYPIAYQPIVIPQNSVFSTKSQTIVIQPKKEAELKITYTAMFANEFSCTLLLSGEVAKYHYAANKCITLRGTPDLTHPSTSIKHPACLYDVLPLAVTIRSPYPGVGNYDLRYSETAIESHEDLLKIAPHQHLSEFKMGRIVITTHEFITDSEGKMLLEGIVRTFHTENTAGYLYFSNAKLGDFMVRIETEWYDSGYSEDVFVMLECEFYDNPELFTERHRLTIDIPMSNDGAWETVKKSCYLWADSEDRVGWREIFEMSAGRMIATHVFHLDRYMMPSLENGQELPIIYKINVGKECNVVLPEEVVMESECKVGIVEIEWKPKPPDFLPNNFVMTLTSEQYRRMRRYRVIFVANKPKKVLKET